MGNVITGDIKECYKEDKNQLFSLVNKDETNNNWLKQKGGFRLNIRQNSEELFGSWTSCQEPLDNRCRWSYSRPDAHLQEQL